MTIRLDAAAQVRSYLLFVGIGSTAVFGLLVLSTQSALSVIQLEKIQRSYTLLILASCANLLVGAFFIGWGVYKWLTWPNPDGLIDALIIGRGLLTFVQVRAYQM